MQVLQQIAFVVCFGGGVGSYPRKAGEFGSILLVGVKEYLSD